VLAGMFLVVRIGIFLCASRHVSCSSAEIGIARILVLGGVYAVQKKGVLLQFPAFRPNNCNPTDRTFFQHVRRLKTSAFSLFFELASMYFRSVVYSDLLSDFSASAFSLLFEPLLSASGQPKP